MGYLDTKETFTIDEILAHQSEIEQDFKEMDKRVLDSTDDPELVSKTEQIQKTDFEAVARHDIRLKKTAPAFQMTVNSRK